MSPYEGPWKAVVVHIVDADTYYFDLRLPCDLTLRRFEVRLNGVSAPERFTTIGKQATAFVKERMPEGSEVLIRTHLVRDTESKDKYRRYVADVTLPTTNEDLGTLLLDAKLAKPGSFKGLDRGE